MILNLVAIRIQKRSIGIFPSAWERYITPSLSLAVYCQLLTIAVQAIVQDAYKGPETNNWFSTPEYPENNKEAVQVSYKQWQNNQKSYAAKGWTTYPNGITCGSKCADKHSNITDWVPGQEPSWEPLAGGEGFGKPHGKDVSQINAQYGGKTTKPKQS